MSNGVNQPSLRILGNEIKKEKESVRGT